MYVGPKAATYQYANGDMELVLDAHKHAMGPKGNRVFSTMLGAAYYGLYHYWYLAPFNQMMFGVSCGASFLFSFMALNSQMSNSSSVIEVVVLPTRDRVRFVTMGGNVYESFIKNVSLVRETPGNITISFQSNDRPLRLMINYGRLNLSYFNPTLLMAIAHPEVHKI